MTILSKGIEEELYLLGLSAQEGCSRSTKYSLPVCAPGHILWRGAPFRIRLPWLVLDAGFPARAGVPRNEPVPLNCLTGADVTRARSEGVFLLCDVILARVREALCAEFPVAGLRLAGVVFLRVAARGITILLSLSHHLNLARTRLIREPIEARRILMRSMR